MSLSHCVQAQLFVCFQKQMMQFLRARKSRLLGRGWHCMSQGRAVSSMTPAPFVLATHITLLQSPFTDSACCSSLPHSPFIHTDTCKLQILLFLMTETMFRYVYLYVDINLAVYNWVRGAVQWWESGKSLGCQSRLLFWTEVSKSRSGLDTGACSISLARAQVQQSPQPRGQHLHEWRPQGGFSPPVQG